MKRACPLSLDRPLNRVEHWVPCALFLLLTANFAVAADYESVHRLVTKRRWTEALAPLEVLALEAPNSSLIGHDLAQTLLRVNRRAEAMRIFRRFGSAKVAETAGRTFILQESYRLYQEGLNFLETGKLNLARERLEKAYEIDRDQLEILIRIIQVETLDLRPDSALRWIQTTREVHGSAPEISLWEGRAFLLLRRFNDAAKVLTAAARDLPTSENAVIALAEALHSLKDEAALRELCIGDLKRNPTHVRLLAQKTRWDLDEFETNAISEAEVRKNLSQLEMQIEKISQSPRPRLESELGLEILDLEIIRQDLITLRARAENLRKTVPINR